jgi:hypothetical protein
VLPQVRGVVPCHDVAPHLVLTTARPPGTPARCSHRSAALVNERPASLTRCRPHPHSGMWINDKHISDIPSDSLKFPESFPKKSVHSVKVGTSAAI